MVQKLRKNKSSAGVSVDQGITHKNSIGATIPILN